MTDKKHTPYEEAAARTGQPKSVLDKLTKDEQGQLVNLSDAYPQGDVMFAMACGHLWAKIADRPTKEVEAKKTTDEKTTKKK